MDASRRVCIRWPTRENMVNPYESPSSLCHLPAKSRQVGTLLLCVVLFNLGWNALKVLRNWPEMTLGLLLIGAILWFVLPTLAAFILWRGWRIGRWILVGLFGLLVMVDLGILGQYLSLALKTGNWGLLFVKPSRIVEIPLYLGATAWLIFSPSIRSLCSTAQPSILSTMANNPHPQSKSLPSSADRGKMVD